MAEDVEENPDVFEIDDFTAASEWERFIYRIEEIIGPHGWKLDNNHSQKLSFLQNIRKQSVPSTSQHAVIGSIAETKIPLGDEWKYQKDTLKFANFQFNLHHHKLVSADDDESKTEDSPLVASSKTTLPKALVEAFDMNYDFYQRTHAIGRWHGLKEFLILTPSESCKEVISTESRTNLLWSSVAIALSNLKCHIPMFIQTGDPRRHLYYGMCIDNSFRTSYEMIHLIYTPHQCNHVQGIMDTFKSKLGCPVDVPISISIRFMYVIKDWIEEMICYDIPNTPECQWNDDIEYFNEIPFGPMDDPLRDFQLAVIWPCLSSELIVDDESSSELDPLQAPQWKLKARFMDHSPTLMYEYLKRYISLCQLTRLGTTAQIIRSLSTDDNEQDDLSEGVSNVLDRLAEPVPSLSSPLHSVVTNATRNIIKTKLIDSPVPEPILQKALKVLFPDAWLNEEEAWLIQGKLDDEQKSLECDAVRSKDKFRYFKSAPIDSLTYKLALSITTLNGIYGVNAVAHLWHEFVLEMRYRYENNILIPRLAQTIPNLNYCLIHQKLQMLNYCIQRRRNRQSESNINIGSRSVSSSEKKNDTKSAVSYKDFSKPEEPTSSRDQSWNDLLANINTPECESVVSTNGNEPVVKDTEDRLEVEDTEDRSTVTVSSTSDNSDDEFFEAQEEISEKQSYKNLDIMSDNADDEGEDLTHGIETSSDQRPEGVQKATDMKLLRNGEPLSIPITQEPSPLTEDMLLEQQDILTRLGTSEEAARIRAQMQSASLLSDMEAFKAANPDCVLADFVRWYSPNDFLSGPETNEEKEELSRLIKESKINDKVKKKNTEEEEEEEEVDKKQSGWNELDDDILLDDDVLSRDDVLGSNDDVWEDIGRLSLRMRMPDNYWREVWNAARSVPVRRQKRLFDDTKEAEKVLHYLSNLNPSSIGLQLFPTVIQASVMRLNQDEDCSRLIGLIEKIVKDTSHIYHPSKENIAPMKRVVDDIRKAELNMVCLKSLRMKFDEIVNETEADKNVEAFIQKLLLGNEICIEGGPMSCIGKIVTAQLEYQKEEDDSIQLAQSSSNTKKVVKTRQSKIPNAAGREYILRTTVPRPNPTSRPSPQRLYTVITPYEFRMAGTFTNDTNFI